MSTWSVVLYISTTSGLVLGVDAVSDRVEAENTTAVLILRVARDLDEAAAHAMVQPSGAYGWVSKLQGAVRINSYAVNVQRAM